MLKALKNSLLSLAYPQQCRVCERPVDQIENGVACSACWSETRIFVGKEMVCAKCGAFFQMSGVPAELNCHKCSDHFYEKARAAGIYEKALAASILDLKKHPNIPRILNRTLIAAFERNGFAVASLIVPVPLSKARQLERGYNQAGRLAEIVSNHSGIPLDTFSLERSKHTPVHRVAMDKKARELTVVNAFKVKRPKLIPGQKVLLVDDVFTSGATASACAKVLKKNGASEVNVLTLARAIMK